MNQFDSTSDTTMTRVVLIAFAWIIGFMLLGPLALVIGGLIAAVYVPWRRRQRAAAEDMAALRMSADAMRKLGR